MEALDLQSRKALQKCRRVNPVHVESQVTDPDFGLTCFRSNWKLELHDIGIFEIRFLNGPTDATSSIITRKDHLCRDSIVDKAFPSAIVSRRDDRQ
jgi:hypothetical protein